MSDLRKRTTDRVLLEAELEHDHLSKLIDAGYVERTGEVISRGPNFEEIEPLLRLIESRERKP